MTDDPTTLKIGLPKGSLQDPTVDLFRRAGYVIEVSSRNYYPRIDDPALSCVMFRSQEMSRYVEDGVIDLGICGHDWVVENGSDVHEVCELKYSRATTRPAQWVLAVPEESEVSTPEQLAGGIVATELTGTVRRYFEEKGIELRKIEFSWGATEVKARLIDAIVDITETGSSLVANKLRVIDTILTSTTRLIANQQTWADPAKRARIEDLALLLQGAIAARGRVGLKLNVPREKLEAVLGLLPAAKSPTVNELADPAWVAIEIIVERRTERELVPRLHRAGATDVFSYPLQSVI
ncbi:ATP phosphoribosyltransferase [Phycisphaera mikurensis]|uniref:ATP phosphoribosyltransferase n=1 Tax=Phycisphaera mikurensis (strain NBRC 102666 / KCTC 22515 / FYK2301M01) TaxID=1142394 RepID=I0IE62_PHYMF|nr:ATP phosphoribosyltransferase [Phycisphaera mikurensis]MBB6441354.1 ATP phosphoribosyltransferase [Phycisphaera mikurensis]BAM03550.1 ATP phosphoribosyltransferase [Phycisphaera mikurensis NBRC 102666]